MEMLRAALLIVVYVGTVKSATVCGIRQIDTNKEICCGQKPHRRFEEGHELGCFQDMVFDKTVMVVCGSRLEKRTIVEREYSKDFFCCFGQFHAKNKYDIKGCCHGEQERIYTHKRQACCSGVVVDRKVRTAQVCHGTTLIDRNARRPRLLQCTGPNGRKTGYDTSSYVCCKQTGLILEKPGPGPYFCHDDDVYNSYQMQLLRLENGTDIVVQKGITMCGNAFITTSSPFSDIYCCDGVIHHVGKSDWNTMECCGTKMYNYTSQSCCNKVILNSDTGCCNGHTPYILMAEDCCENKVIDRAEELCCRNNIVRKKYPSHYGCCKIDHAWTTYNELNPPVECLLTHLRHTFNTNPTRQKRLGGNQNIASETTGRSPLEKCPFTECFDREQKQRRVCRKLFELDIYLDGVNITNDGSTLHITLIQPDAFVNKKFQLSLPYICPCLERGHVYTVFTSKGWVRKLTADRTFESSNYPTINKKDFLVKRGSGADSFACTIRRKHSAFYNSWRGSPVL
ncbi:uncharacterized protein LOC128245375 [Mya arenaria]|uniref:uncharacterized protein LOC128245375 n=1 Tax=Mya arenaria TaxID=6604 RepID=UPI0022E9928C|nr:uncharacterized protein LOC128245375 [Mya arenaria]XP_052819475.1 uncharacterized protein LOC128245375 [Mya arenaria]XP_052819476.1 uncharacterized protein LOC128245375 [Mya arenaria]